jgi:hypothetical protein
MPAPEDQHNIDCNPAFVHQGRIWLRIGTQIYNDFGGCKKVGKQDCCYAAFKFQLIALLLTPRGHQGIAQFLGYLSRVDRPTLLSTSNCISAADNYP